MASPHQSGVLAENINPLEEGEKQGLTLNTRAINIIWGGDGSKDRYWKRVEEDSSEAIELLGVYWLEVTGKIPLHNFSPSTTYRMFVNLKLTSDASGWSTPVIFKLHLPGNNKLSREIELTNYLNKGWVDVPDGGIEFNVPQDNSGMLKFSMYEIECEEWKKGLILKEVKFVTEINYRTII